MAKYNQIQYGSTGDDVKKLQDMLNGKGYTLDPDGIFGEQTEKAVRDYQQKNGLDVDGIVGDNTWGMLYGNETTNNDPSTTQDDTPEEITQATTTEPWKYDPFKPSEDTEEANRNRRENENNKPGEYKSNWQSQIDEILDKIFNREDFQYDVNKDAMYQMLRDQYMMLGQQASADVMGQAAAMTGGYGNTYAQSAGQQAYQAYLQQLNDRVPELYQMNLDRYNREGEQMYSQYGLIMDQENQEYGRYRDMIGDWQSEQGRLDDEYWNQWNRDYGQYSDNRNFDYGQYRDRISDEQWQAQFDEAKRQYDEQMANKGSSGGGYRGSLDDGHDSGENYQAPKDWNDEDVIAFQKKYGLDANGIWGPETQSVYDAISDLNAIIANNDTEVEGADNKNAEKRSAIIAYLNEALEAGDITDKVYQILKNEYAGGSSGGRYTY